MSDPIQHDWDSDLSRDEPPAEIEEEVLDPDQPMGIGVRSLRDSARRLGVLFEDVSDPDRIPCPEAEFLDGDHATAECLGRVVARLVLHRPDRRD